MVTKFIYALLRANKNEQDEFFARQIPKGVFSSERPQIKWIYDYRDRHGRYPTLAAFKARFPKTDIPKTKDSVASCFQTILDKSTYDSVTKTIDSGRELFEGGSSISEVVAHLRAGFDDINLFDTQYEDIAVDVSPVSLRRYRERVRQRLNNSLNKNPTPWKSLNELLGFSEWGESNIIASRTSIGKTWIVAYWAEYLRMIGERVLFITKEMPSHQIADRFESIRYKLSHPLFRAGALSPAQLKRWILAKKRFERNPPPGELIISGQETITDAGFAHIIQKVMKYKPTVLFVDGAYLIWPENSKNLSLPDRMMRISNMMKRIAKVYKLICYSTVQAKRESEDKQGNSDVSLKDLFGSDAWSQDADNLYLISGLRGSNLRKIKLAKGRESALGEFHIEFALDPKPSFNQTGRAAQLQTEGEKSVAFQTL